MILHIVILICLTFINTILLTHRYLNFMVLHMILLIYFLMIHLMKPK